MLIAAEHSVRQAMVPIELLKLHAQGRAILGLSAQEKPDWRSFQCHSIVHPRRLHRLIRGFSARLSREYRSIGFVFVAEISKLSLPVVALLVEQLCQVEQISLASPVVEPKHGIDVVLPTIPPPIPQWPPREGS